MEFRREVWIRGVFPGIVIMEMGGKSMERNEISTEVSEDRTKKEQGLIPKALQVEKKRELRNLARRIWERNRQ